MSALYRAFYMALLWCSRFELAVAMAAPERNRRHVEALQRDISDYERALIRLDLAL